MSDLDAVKRRLQALLQKTTANGCTAEEASAAAAKVAELLKQHGLDAADLVMGQETVPGGSRATVIDRLWSVIAFCTGCVVVRDQDDRLWRYIGRQPGPAVASYLHVYLHRHIEGALTLYKASPEYKRKRKGPTRRRACEAFRLAMAAILARMVREHFGTPEPHEIEQARAYRDKLFRNLRPMPDKASSLRQKGALAAGAAAAAGVEIRTGLGGASTTLIGRD